MSSYGRCYICDVFVNESKPLVEVKNHKDYSLILCVDCYERNDRIINFLSKSVKTLNVDKE